MGQRSGGFFAEYPGWEQLYVEHEAQCGAPCLHQCGRDRRRYRYPALDADERDAEEIPDASLSAPVFLGLVLRSLHLLDICAGLSEIFQTSYRCDAPQKDEFERPSRFLGIQGFSCLYLRRIADLPAGLV